MSSTDQGWTGKWVSDKLAEHTNVASVELVSPQLLEVQRKKYGKVIVATMAIYRVRNRNAKAIAHTKPKPHFLVNIPVESYWNGKAIENLHNQSIGLGGVADLFRAMNQRSVRKYVNPEIAFVARSLEQHSNVMVWRHIWDRKLEISRYEGRPVRVVLLKEYDVTADSVRTARERYGKCDAYVRTNPNSRVSTAAARAVKSMDTQVLDWSGFFAFLGKFGRGN